MLVLTNKHPILFWNLLIPSQSALPAPTKPIAIAIAIPMPIPTARFGWQSHFWEQAYVHILVT